jgi:hypothetical protein
MKGSDALGRVLLEVKDYGSDDPDLVLRERRSSDDHRFCRTCAAKNPHLLPSWKQLRHVGLIDPASQPVDAS